MLARATDFNVSPREWKITCMLMRKDIFLYLPKIRNPITGEREEHLRHLSDPELSRKDILDWMETYRRQMEQIWMYGNKNVSPPVKPLREIYNHTPILYWYTQNDQMMRELAEKEKEKHARTQ